MRGANLGQQLRAGLAAGNQAERLVDHGQSVVVLGVGKQGVGDGPLDGDPCGEVWAVL